ncbi:aminoglycoside phosphotransferase family protein [Candidatus Parcubacteria bacterium]|nr:MAG: aminoglycoside phosphotransferase family protein [Candidatus Parcubacteria bacterium]
MKKKALSEKTKAAVAKLLEHDFVCDVLDKRLGDYYKDFKRVVQIESEAYKRHLGITSAVFVVDYKVKYQTKSGGHKNIDIFASAHSDGSRLGAYQKTKILYEHGFDKGKFRVTTPLFFLKEQKAFFYISSPGQSLFNFFTQDPKVDLKPAMHLATAWIKKLHSFDYQAVNFVWPNFKINAMVPAPRQFIPDFYSGDEKRGRAIEGLVSDLKKMVDSYNRKIDKVLIYGDYHPENIIITSLKARSLEMIDFTDLAIGDPMMDIGIFIQQFDFMGHNFISRSEMNDYKTFFVEAYFGKKFEKIEIDFINRINIYQSWAAMRSVVFIFYKKDVENPVDGLLRDAIGYLSLAQEGKHKINLS